MISISNADYYADSAGGVDPNPLSDLMANPIGVHDGLNGPGCGLAAGFSSGTGMLVPSWGQVPNGLGASEQQEVVPLLGQVPSGLKSKVEQGSDASLFDFVREILVSNPRPKLNPKLGLSSIRMFSRDRMFSNNFRKIGFIFVLG